MRFAGLTATYTIIARLYDMEDGRRKAEKRFDCKGVSVVVRHRIVRMKRL